ncbi:hypothetical protein EDB83DRAFT_1868870 [Lactarius deliciosus]|nr:hypothetical protein EDB83DRAFT_1868870 [Lactarius deliciosus]
MLKRTKNILCWVVSVLFCDLRKAMSPSGTLLCPNAQCMVFSSLLFLCRLQGPCDHFQQWNCAFGRFPGMLHPRNLRDSSTIICDYGWHTCEVMRGETACTAPLITGLQSGPLFVPHSMSHSCVASASLCTSLDAIHKRRVKQTRQPTIVNKTSASGHTNIFR